MPWARPKFRDWFRTCSDKWNYWFEQPYGLRFIKFSSISGEDIWGSLHERFNTAPMTIMDQPAWHSDVVELMLKSDTVEELYAELEKRKKQRLDELTTAMTGIEHPTGRYLIPSGPLNELSEAVFVFHDRASMYDCVRVVEAMTKLEQIECATLERELEKKNAVRAKARRELRRRRRREKEHLKKAAAITNTPAQRGGMVTPPDDKSPGGGENDTGGDNAKKRKREDVDADEEREDCGKRLRDDATTPPPADAGSRAASPAAAATSPPRSYGSSESSDFPEDSEDSDEDIAREVREARAAWPDIHALRPQPSPPPESFHQRCGSSSDESSVRIGDPDECGPPTRINFENHDFQRIEMPLDDALIQGHMYRAQHRSKVQISNDHRIREIL